MEHIYDLLSSKLSKANTIWSNEFALGDGLVTANGQLWIPQRLLLNESFHADAFKLMILTFSTHATELVTEWNQTLQSPNLFDVDLSNIMQRLTLDIMCHAGFGYKPDKSIIRDPLSLAIADILQEVNIRITDPTDWCYCVV